MVFEFGPPGNTKKYRLDGDKTLKNGEEFLHLSPNGRKLLLLLVEANGDLVELKTIQTKLGINKTQDCYKYINSVRNVLGGRKMQAIVTVQRTGYRFGWKVTQHTITVAPEISADQLKELQIAASCIQRRCDPWISQAILSLESLPLHIPGRFELLSIAYFVKAGCVSGARVDVEIAAQRAYQATRQNSKNWHAHAALGLAKSVLLKWPEAGEAFREAFRLNKDETVGSLEYQIYQISRGETDSIVQAWMSKEAKNGPNAEFIHQSLCQVEYMRGHIQESLTAIEEAKVRIGTSWVPPSLCAVLAWEAHDYRKAMKELNLALKIASLQDESNPISSGLKHTKQLLKSAIRRTPEPHLSSGNLAEALPLLFGYCIIGNAGRVFEILQDMESECYPFLCWILRFPCIRNIAKKSRKISKLVSKYDKPVGVIVQNS